MKISKDELTNSSPEIIIDERIAAFTEVGISISIDYGVLVDTYWDGYFDGSFEIWYEVKGHAFDCANDLRKALDNKAFL